MMKQFRNAGTRCSVCNRPFQPRQLRDGGMSQTCGQTACVATYSRRRDSGASGNGPTSTPRRPQNAW